MRKKVFGNAWWIEETKSGKFALINSEINVGDKKLTDLTDNQLKKIDIELFDTRAQAEKERIKRVLNAL